ncbi:MAG: DUF2254 domain-containing protein [Rhodospirillaceae bacterium]|nr:DUF2254 domain-containing protein [Rhodospirillaceae bacterium]
MTARIRKLLSDLSEAFWLLPGLLVAAGVVLALVLVAMDRDGRMPSWLPEGIWLYDGGATGARTLLGAVAGSTIGVAGTVFSITIAALSLAAGQMGPRLLRNFMRDRGNQVTLGFFLGTFSYALMVLRSVRTAAEGDFVPHLALGVGILLAFLCVATLVYFVGHVAGRINVDTVIELVSEDAQTAIRRLATDERAAPAPDPCWNGEPIIDERRGYLQQLDADGLADWAAAHKTAIRLLVRPGDYVFPGAPIALADPPVEGIEAAIANATALGHQRGSAADLEFAVRQMVEVAVRALSPGINDPHTAISVVDRLGAALCEIAPLSLPPDVFRRDDVPVLLVPAVEYDGLVDTMFHMIRQNAAGNPPLLIRLLEVLAAVASCERDPARLKTLRRHADLALGDAERSIGNPSDVEDARRRHGAFIDVQRHGATHHMRHRADRASMA